jgi:hypothetical protein
MHELMSDYLTTQSRKISYFYGSNSDHEQFRVLLARRRTYRSSVTLAKANAESLTQSESRHRGLRH